MAFRASWFILSSVVLLAQAEIDSSCTQFTSSGPAANTYQWYRLYDFRNINNNKPELPGLTSPAAKRVVDSTWKNDWYIRDYPRKSAAPPNIPVDFNPGMVGITNSNESSKEYTTYLTLSSARRNETVQQGGEITYQEHNITYASISVYGRVHGTEGACAGIFTYYNDTEESDMEIFTKDPATFIHYSNQPSSTGAPDWTNIPGATVNVSTQSSSIKWTDWHVHRLDWTPGHSYFSVDGNLRNQTTLQVPIPDPMTQLYIDMWGANSTWVGQMPLGGEAWFDIQWVEILFNSTSQPTFPAGTKSVVCSPSKKDHGGSATSWGERLSAQHSRWLLALVVVAALCVQF